MNQVVEISSWDRAGSATWASPRDDDSRGNPNSEGETVYTVSLANGQSVVCTSPVIT